MNDYLTHSHWIGKFTDKELSSEQESTLLNQASHNPLLRNELRLDQDISELLADYDRIKLSETIGRTIKKGRTNVIIPVYLRIAASVIILMALSALAGLLINYSKQNSGHALLINRPVLNLQPDRIPGLLYAYGKSNLRSTPAERREIVQNRRNYDPYTPIPEYEFLVGTVTRDISVFVVSPVPRVKCKCDSLLQFNWRWLTGPVPVNLEITDNHGRIVLNTTQIMDVGYTLDTKHWARGLYYYKITAGDELVTVGSISIY